MRVKDLVLATASLLPVVALTQKYTGARVRARNEALEQANQGQREFLARLSHDLRTPLNSILGFAQLLQLEDLTEDQADSLAHIVSGGRHMLELINEVMDISRIEAGRLTLSPEPVHVGGVIRETVDLVRPLSEQRDITLRAVTGCGEGVYARADRQRLPQVLLNLLSNAVKYNRHGGLISVECRVTGDRVRILVRDTGAGIPAEKLDLLFRPFERLGAEHSDVEGTGLGLMLSRTLTEAMGGTLGVETSAGEGSVFWIELPSASPVDETPSAPPPITVLRRTDVSGLVLYIEDDPSHAQVVQRLLAHRPGVRLQHAFDGDGALQMIERERPDLVLLDLHVPDVPWEVLLLRIRRRAPRVPVAVLTADASPRQQRRLRAAGATAYFTKPVNVTQVLSLVDEVLAARPRGQA